MGKITHWYVFDVPEHWQDDEPGPLGVSQHTLWFEHIQLVLRELIVYLQMSRPKIGPGLTIALPSYTIKFENSAVIYWRGDELASFPVHYQTLTAQIPTSIFPGIKGAPSQVRERAGADPESSA